jgi:formate-dependent nitrite reductase membrane component NrfD
MNLFVADPHWGWWIIWYFFLGGIAAGAYFTSALIELVGAEQDRRLARAGYIVAFPMIVVCGVLLILDLDRPTRFWHMLVRSELVHEAWAAGWPLSARGWGLMFQAPLLKYWSPMSIGSWALSLFGLCSLLSFEATLWPQGRIARWMERPRFGTAIRVLGCGVGFFVAAYTGALLTATNQPIWSDSAWIAALFLTSAASTGAAAMAVLLRWNKTADAQSLANFERADLVAVCMELAIFAVFLISLGSLLSVLLSTWHGRLLAIAVPVLGMLVPLAIHLRPRWGGRHAATLAAVCVLLGGFLLRYAILSTPREILLRETSQPSGGTFTTSFGPESGRPRGGGSGADPGNRADEVTPRSKLFDE